MKKLFSFLVIFVLVLSGLGAVALPEIRYTQKENELYDYVYFSDPVIKDKGNYVSIDINECDNFVLEENRPMLPMYVKKFKLPFGVKNIDVYCTINDIFEKSLDKKIILTSDPKPLTLENNIPQGKQFYETYYMSSEIYPNTWYSYKFGCGIDEDNSHVTFVSVQIYPVRYSPHDNKIYYIDNVDVSVSYDNPSKQVVFDDEYDMVIISPRKFSFILRKLVNHKIDVGIETIIKTVEDIYEEYSGVDNPEKIKYFIKDAIEDWGVKYVLLIGGLKRYYDNDDRDNENEGSTDWYIPVRYSNIYDDEEDTFEPGFISDLYYADVYKIGGEFENWDSNSDGIFGAWDKPGYEDDIIDQYPDVHLGRLACRNKLEVRIMVNKIINYESINADSSWFNNMICAAGDTYISDYELEGELTCEQALAEMTDFNPIRLYASYNSSGLGPTPTPKNITSAITNGSGFLLFEGHGSPGLWGTRYPYSDLWTPFYTIYHFLLLRNKEKLPVCIVGGCHNSMFNVSYYKTYGPDNESYWSNGLPIPECFSWWLTRKIRGGSIATIGSTGLSYGTQDSIGLSAYLDYLFFWAYGTMEKHVLGETWSTSINEYISTSGLFGKIDVKTVEEWLLLGDPSLMIGGYTV